MGLLTNVGLCYVLFYLSGVKPLHVSSADISQCNGSKVAICKLHIMLNVTFMWFDHRLLPLIILVSLLIEYSKCSLLQLREMNLPLSISSIASGNSHARCVLGVCCCMFTLESEHILSHDTVTGLPWSHLWLVPPLPFVNTQVSGACCSLATGTYFKMR